MIEKNNQGFTLIEILLVIFVVGVLAFVAAWSFSGLKTRVRDMRRVNDITNLEEAMRIVKDESGGYLRACGNADYSGAVAGCVGEGENYLLSNYLLDLTALNDPSGAVEVCDAKCSVAPCNYPLLIDKDSYQAYFWLEKSIGEYAAGCHKLTEKGID
jgi:prepilin-type N-terminal cleavage/methylation domain-containing protein